MKPPYPYPPGNITISQAVGLIAVVVYPDLDKTAARKRVRSRIRYAQETEKIPSTDPILASDFFQWAVTGNPDWSALAKVQGLPIPTATASGHLRMPLPRLKAHAVVVPTSHEELQEKYIWAEAERYKLAEEVASLKEQLAIRDIELAQWREKDSKLRQKRVSAGQNGGRGKSI